MGRRVKLWTGRMFLALMLFFPAAVAGGAGAAEQAPVLWTDAGALGPSWGFYPINNEYGGRKPLGTWAAMARGGGGTLTWVADFPADGVYHAWARQFRGRVSVSVNEEPVGEPAGGGGGGYDWRRLGAVAVTAGRHHVDVSVSGGVFCSVLFSADSDFTPDDEALPALVEDPVTRAPRKYRDDSALAAAAGEAGLAVAALPRYLEHNNDILPTPGDILSELRLWGAAGQHVTGEFAIRALEPLENLSVTLAGLEGPGGNAVPGAEIDLRVVHLREKRIDLFRSWRTTGVAADLVLRDDRGEAPLEGDQGGYGGGVARTAVPAGESRHFILTVHVPAGHPAGLYRGALKFRAGDDLLKSLPVAVDVLPVALEPAEGWYAAYHRHRPEARADGSLCPVYLEQLRLAARYGMNATTLYGGIGTIDYAAAARLTRPPMLMNNPPRSGEAVAGLLARAREAGLEGLLWYGVDEPSRPEQIERAREIAARALATDPPAPVIMAINNRGAMEALKDVVSHPVLVLYRFGYGSAAIRESREHGFRPVSYWLTNRHYPLYCRVNAGLYNAAAGYYGTAPWAYRDENHPGSGYNMTVPDGRGRPVPSLRLYAYRDGVDDVRYLQALDRAISRLEEALAGAGDEAEGTPGLRAVREQARETRRTYYESISGAWHFYVAGLDPERYDQARRAFAEAVLLIDGALAARAGDA